MNQAFCLGKFLWQFFFFLGGNPRSPLQSASNSLILVLKVYKAGFPLLSRPQAMQAK
jgi:hypothetical protein